MPSFDGHSLFGFHIQPTSYWRGHCTVIDLHAKFDASDLLLTWCQNIPTSLYYNTFPTTGL